MTEWKRYAKKEGQPLRPYIPGEDMTGISVWEGDVLEEGGMIAMNISNPDDKWYIGKEFFKENYVLLGDV